MNLRTIRPTREIIFLLLVVFIYSFFIITTQTDTQLNIIDLAWYVNRAELTWRGIVTPFFMYTLGYPLLLGGIYTVTQNMVFALMFLNIVLTATFLFLLYFVGRTYFNRSIGWIALVLAMTHVYAVGYFRQIQTMMLFCCLLLVILLLCEWLVRSRSLQVAMLLGLVVSIAFLTRFEGITYGIFIIAASLRIYWQTRRWQLALGLFFAACLVIVPFFLAYLPQLFSGFLSSGQQDILYFLFQLPTGVKQVSLGIFRYYTYVLNLWVSVIWILLAWATLDRWSPYAISAWVFLGLGMFHLHIVMALIIDSSVAPFAYNMPTFMWLLLPISWALWRLGEVAGTWKLTAIIVIFIACVHSYHALRVEPLAVPFAYWDSEPRKSAARLDEFLRANGYENTVIWSLCHPLVLYSEADLRYLYRFAGYMDRADLAESPVNLLPQMAQNNELLLYCDEVNYGDWRDLLLDRATYSYNLQLIYKEDAVSLFKAITP